jgi:copper chaperone
MTEIQITDITQSHGCAGCATPSAESTPAKSTTKETSMSENAEKTENTKNTKNTKNTVTSTYTVSGMTCGHCVSSVTEELTALDGVAGVEVDLPTGAVIITSAAPLDGEAVRSAVSEAGYQLVG